jgi:hypothetical protein
MSKGGNMLNPIKQNRIIKPVFTLFAMGFFLSQCQSRNATQEDTISQARPSSNNQAKNSFGVNDLTFLFPLEKDAAQLLPKVNENPHPLLSNDQFNAILDVHAHSFNLDYRASEGGPANHMKDLSKWNIVAMRLQHCLQKKVTDPCVPSINLVAQPMVTGTITGDFAMHLVYVPGKSTVELFKELLQIREKHAPDLSHLTSEPSSGLRVHPILKQKGLTSAYAKAIKEEFIYKHLSPNQLVAVATSFIEPERLQPWLFLAFNAKTMVSDAQRRVIPEKNNFFHFDPGTSIHSCDITGKQRQICMRSNPGPVPSTQIEMVDTTQKTQANPSGNTPSGFTSNGTPYLDDYLQLILKEARGDPSTRFSTVKKNASFWASVLNKLDNPKLVGPEESNCSSCHRPTVERSRFSSEIPELGTPQTEFAFKAKIPERCNPVSGINYNKSGGLKTFNVRNLGYFHGDPVLAQRVVNETVATCEAMVEAMGLRK